MNVAEIPTHTRDSSGKKARPKWPTGLVSRREAGVVATVLAVLALAAWAMIGFYTDRPSPLPRRGDPLPAESVLAADSALETDLMRITAALAQRDASGAVLVEALYNTPAVFAALSRRNAARQGGDEAGAESLLETYQRYHETDRYLVFSLALESSGPNLQDYQPQAMSRLRTASGREAPAENWVESPGPTSDRHRVGVLHFPQVTGDGQALLTKEDDWLELVLLDLDGKDRVLRWKLPIASPDELKTFKEE